MKTQNIYIWLKLKYVKYFCCIILAAYIKLYSSNSVQNLHKVDGLEAAEAKFSFFPFFFFSMMTHYKKKKDTKQTLDPTLPFIQLKIFFHDKYRAL